MRNLDLGLLRTFVAIAEQESFVKAAQRVSRTQSAVTQQMQRLEAQVQAKLFQRAGRGKALTEQGVALLDYARQILAVHDEAVRSLAATESKEPITIGAPPDVADTILPALLSRFSKLLPGVRINVHVARGILLMDALKRGEIELTVSMLDRPGYERIVLRNSPAAWLCAADYVYDRTQPLPLIISEPPSMFREMALEHLNRAGVPWRIVHTSSTLPGVRAALRGGLGVTVRTIEMLSPEFKVLGDREGLPRLPDVTFYLYLRDFSTTGEVARQLFRAVAGSR
ncbi:MAG: transcriptional regulator LrhA [Betaproteobacteria bacterium]|nr:transcriptional regulator LrhA [Betaproteobacteria bacterium]